MLDRIHVTISQLPAAQRPQERLARLGPAALADAELLAILLGTGGRDRNALSLAMSLLAACPEGLSELATRSREELCRWRGVGPVKAARLQAAIELARRWRQTGAAQRQLLDSPAAVHELCGPRWQDATREHFIILALNTKNRLLGELTVSVGHLSASLVHPREVFKEAIRRSAAGLIAVHNHPSGDPSPSPEDVALTGRLIEAGQLLGIPLLDHVIIGHGRYQSLREGFGLWTQPPLH